MDDAINNPDEVYDNKKPNHHTGQKQRTYVDKDGNWVVMDENGRVTQVNEKGNTRQLRPEKAPDETQDEQTAERRRR